MENSLDDKKTQMEEPLLEEEEEDHTTHQKGGLRTLPFIIVNEAFEKMASYGLAPNMTLYLMKQYHMEMTSASYVMFFWSAATNFMPVLGAIISDSYLGRFRTIGFGSIICLTGMILLWSTTLFPQARPPPCDEYNETCIPPTIFQSFFLCTSLGLMSIGAGGIRSTSLAFGADQLQTRHCRRNSSLMESYFSWYYASYTLSVLIAVTCVVYVQVNMGWKIGFAVPAVLMLFSAVSFYLASSFYVKLKSKSSLVIGFIQVITASYKNRRLKLSAECSDIVYHRKKGSALVFPSEKLRCLNKACIVRDPEKDLTPDGKAADPWSLCTVEQTEEFKSLIRVLPIWSTGMIMSINISQNSFPVLQATSMNRNIGSSFIFPAGSFSMFTIIAVIIWIALYDRIFLPMASRIMGKRVHITTKKRMGAGIFLSFMAMMVTAIVENIRRSLAIREGYEEKPEATVQLSAMWLVPQNCLNGFAEAMNAIGQNEFYFSELPRSMSSIASTLNGLGMSFANLLASFILSCVDDLSKRGGKESWISSNINKGHYDYYYLLLGGLSMANLIYFLVCSRAYGACKEERNRPNELLVC